MSSWKQYGGINKFDKMNFLNVKSIVTDTIVIKDKYFGVFDISGDMAISKNLTVGDDASFNANIFVGGDASFNSNVNIEGNIYGKSNFTLYDKLYLGSDASASYFFGDASGFGLNVEKPLAALDICGNYIEVLNVFSNQTENRNIIARNLSRRGISVYTSDTSSNICFFNDSSVNSTGFDGCIQYEKGGIMTIDVSDNTQILSKLSVSNREDNSHILGETAIIYDICNNTWAYDVYDVLSANTGNALSLLSSDNSSNTFLHLIAPNKNGLAMGGGAYPLDTDKSMGTIGLLDSSGVYRPNQTIVRGNNLVKYKTTLAINSHAPRIDTYVVDINGPLHITNGEITNVESANIEIKKMLFERNSKKYGIAFGSPYSVSEESYLHQIYYTNDGGETWNSSNIADFFTDGHATDFETSNHVLYSGYVYDQSYSIVGGDSNYLFYSNDGGVSWNNITGITSETEDSNIINGLYTYSLASNYKRNILSYSDSLKYFDVSFTEYDTNMTNSQAYNIEVGSIDTLVPSKSVNAMHGYDNYVYLAGAGIQKYDVSNTQFVTSESNLNDLSYNSVFAYDSSYVIAVGKNIISYTEDGGENWTDKTIANTVLQSVYMYDVSYSVAVGNAGTILYTKDSGANWTTASGEIVNTSGNGNLLVNGDLSLNNVFITDKNAFTVSVVTNAYQYTGIQDYSLGKTNIMYCYLPNMINRANNYLMDVCGNMKLDGDLYIGDNGNIISSSSSFALLKENVETIYFGNDASKIYIGQSNTGNVFIQNSLDISQNLYIRGNIQLDGKFFDGTEVIFDGPMQMSNTLTITNATVSTSTGTGSIITAGGVGIAGNVYVGGNTNITGNLNTLSSSYINVENTNNSTSSGTGAVIVKGGIGIAKNLYMDGSMNINNTEASTSHLTGAFVVGGGAGFSGNVYVGDRIDVSGNVDISGNLNVRTSAVSRFYNSNASTSSSTGAVIVSGGVGIEGNINVDGNSNFNNVLSITSNIDATSGGVGSLVVNGGTYISKSLYLSGNFTVGSSGIISIINTTDASSNKTAALSIKFGGLYVDKSTYINSNITGNANLTVNGNTITFSNSSCKVNIAGTSASNSTSTGAFVVSGGVGIGGNIFIGENANLSGKLSVNSMEESTTASTGAFIVSGGVGISGNTNIGEMANITGNLNTTGNSYINVSNTVNSTTSGTGALIVSGGVGIAKNLYMDGILNINNAQASTSTSTGAFVLGGGAGISGNAYIGGTAYVTGITTITNMTDSTSTGSGALVVSGGVGLLGNAYIGLNANIAGITTITDTTISTSAETGALVVSGGVGISGNAYIGGTANIGGITNITNTTASSGTGSGALVVSGGVGVAGDTYIGLNANIGGTANIGGITTIANATVSLGTGSGALIVSGGVGISGNAYIGANANITGTANIAGNTRITIETASSSSASGALIVSGGVGIGGSAYIGVNANIGGTANITGATTISGVTTISNGSIGTSSSGGALVVSGGIGVAGNSYFGKYVNAATFNATSDYRVKSGVTKLNSDFSVDKLEPVFYYNNILKNNDVGFIAHKVQEVYPYLVNGEKDGENYQSLNYNGIIGILVHEIQELKKTVGELKEKMNLV
jgi:UDP-3-O-[3-hydroxymyristoyl] glucosamine N-acyltransferase